MKDLSNWVFASTLSSLVTLSTNDAIKFVFENSLKLPSFLLLKNKDWTDALTDTLTEYCS